MWVETSRFGAFEVKEEEILHFPLGLPGFEPLKHFFLVWLPDNPAFIWLQAAAAPEIAFLLVNPFLFFPGYNLELREQERAFLKVKSRDDVLVYVIVTVPPAGVAEMTANLLGPVLINRLSRLGIQVIQDGSGYTTKHRLFPPGPDARSLPCAAGG